TRRELLRGAPCVSEVVPPGGKARASAAPALFALFDGYRLSSRGGGRSPLRSRPARRATAVLYRHHGICCPGGTARRIRQRSRERGQATMQASEVPRAMAAAMAIAASLDLTVDDAIVLHDS